MRLAITKWFQGYLTKKLIPGFDSGKRTSSGRMLSMSPGASTSTYFWAMLLSIGFLGSSLVQAQSFHESWEQSEFKSSGWSEEGHSNAISHDIASSGNNSYKSSLPAEASGNPRSELRFDGNQAAPKFQDQLTTWRISFSFFVPPDFKSDPVKESILQLKDIMDPCDKAGGNPPFKIGIEKNEFNATVRWTDQKCATRLGLKYYGKLMELQPGKWHHFVLEVHWDHRAEGNGYIDLLASTQGKPTEEDRLFSYKGPTGYHDKYGHYLKLGIYKWLWKKDQHVKTSINAGVRQRVFYYDDVTVEKLIPGASGK